MTMFHCWCVLVSAEGYDPEADEDEGEKKVFIQRFHVCKKIGIQYSRLL